MSASTLRFLADESCDFGVVAGLRAEGFDVLLAADAAGRSVDADVIERAARERRVLVTEDKDFGWYAFVKGVDAGVILIRFPGNARQLLVETMIRTVKQEQQRLAGCFTVVEPARVRIKPRP